MTHHLDDDLNTNKQQKCGFIAVIGAPNAGKSSLVNALVGAKVSIVTHKVQTTRARVRGVAIEDPEQLVFIDTPGIFTPKRRLDRAMVAAAWEGAQSVDATIVVVDAPHYVAAQQLAEGRDVGGVKQNAAKRAAADTDAIIEALKERGAKAILALNKIDTIPREQLLPVMQSLSDSGVFEEVFLISATRGDGLEDLKKTLIARMPDGPWMFPEDQLSDISDRLMAAEITREKLFLRLHQELPYETTVETTDWKAQGKDAVRIEQTIFVARDSQKGIVLGKGGQTLKAIGAAAREELMEIWGLKVHLFLHVKLRENWAEEPARYREMGLDIVQ